MEDITKLLSKANEQLAELNKTVSSLEGGKIELADVKSQVLDFRNKVSAAKHCLEYKKGELMTVLFDLVFRLYGKKTYTVGSKREQKSATLAIGAWKYFVVTGQHDGIRLMELGDERHNELFNLLWDAMLEDVRIYLTRAPSDILERINELDTLKKQLEALPSLCQSVTVPP